jgi:integrase
LAALRTPGNAHDASAVAGNSPAERESKPVKARPNSSCRFRPRSSPNSAHIRQQAAERLTAGAAWQGWDLVFCTPFGAPIDSRDDWEDWRALIRAAGLRDARVHDARHTAATLLLDQGVSVRVVQEILGHSQLSQTERYTHVTRALSRQAADRMSEALWG